MIFTVMGRHAGGSSVKPAKPVINDDSSLNIIVMKYRNIKKKHWFLYRIFFLSIEKSKKVSLNNVKADSVWKTRSKVKRVYDTFILRILMFIVCSEFNATSLVCYSPKAACCVCEILYCCIVYASRNGPENLDVSGRTVESMAWPKGSRT